MQMRSQIEAILFDAGGVLVLPDPTVLAPLLEFYGATASIEQYVRAHYLGMAAKSRTRSLESDWSAYNEAYVRHVGVPEADCAVASAVLARTRSAHLWRYPVAHSAAALMALHDAGMPIGVVSNASGQIEEILLRSGVCQVGAGPGAPMRCIIDSHIVGVAKPDPKIFDFALPFFPGIERANIAYVGDSVMMDVEGSLAAGLTPYLVDPDGDSPACNATVIGSLKELLVL